MKLALCFLLCSLLQTAKAQSDYHNILNARFRAIGNGPQSSIVVDVADPSDKTAVQKEIDTKIRSVMLLRNAVTAQEIAHLRQTRALSANNQIPVVDVVVLRHNGKLLMPPAPPVTRGIGRGVPPGNRLTFTASTTGSYAFDVPTASALDSVVNNTLYPELVNRLGPPLWNGAVTILNKDDNPTKVSGIIGVTVVINPDGSIDIDLPNFSTDQDKYLGLLQAMAQTFYGPLTIGFDAWNVGFSRAAAVVAAQDLQGKFPSSQNIDPAADFYYTPYYDLLNQPALGNSTFLPPTKSNQILGGLGGMLVPRLQMASSVWLKCFIENPQFFINFNNAYYDAWNQDHTIANDTGRLSALASTAVGGSVEGQPFSSWYQQQFILDTSVTTGPKEFLFITPTLPDAAHPQDGAAIVVLYYQTTSTGDELDLNSVCNPIFYDYTFKASLTLSGADQPINIVSGEGYTQPYFTGLGTAQTQQMRVAMEFPINSVYSQTYYPANQSVDSNNTPRDFFGVVIGSDNGQLTAQFSGGNGTPVTTPVFQGSFGAIGGASIPNNFTQVALSYQPINAATGQNNGPPIIYRRNVFQRSASSSLTGLPNVSSIFALVAPAPTVQLFHAFAAGPQMISLPVQPLTPDLASVFGLPSGQTLLAQWRQDAGGDNYLRYPSMPLYQPGYGFWSNFLGGLNGGSGQNGIPIVGVSNDNLALLSSGLEYGWNQIGNPFTANLNLATDPTQGSAGGVEFQYQGQTANLANAIANGWVAAGVFGYNPSTASFNDITGTLPAGAPFLANTLETWKGYFLLVKVSEGITITYVNPSPNTRSVLSSRLHGAINRSVGYAPPNGWRMPLFLQDDTGKASSSLLGQSSQGADAYVSQLDAAAPPALTSTSSMSISFPHPDWTGGKGVGINFLSDIRRSGAPATWNIQLNLPSGGSSYTLSWGRGASLPKGLSLDLIDTDTGDSVLMNTHSEYTFQAAQNETTRHIQIVADPQGMRFASILALHVDTISSGGRAVGAAQISYNITGAANCSLLIRGSGGQIIRHLIEGRAVTPGPQRTIWDLRDDRGRTLPGGVYIIEAQASAPDGRLTRSIIPFTLIR